MSEKNIQKKQPAPKKGRPKKKKINELREVKITNHYANITPEERFSIGIRIFEILGLIEVCEEKK